MFGGGDGNNPFGGGQNNPPQSPFGQQQQPVFGGGGAFGAAPAPATTFGAGAPSSGFGASTPAFGGGGTFGSSAPAAAFGGGGAFGASTPFGGGAAAASTPFGGSTPAPAPGFGGSFGGASATPFGGGSAAPSPTSGFAAASTTFGGGGFGSSPVGSGSSNTFGGGTSAPAPAFGSASTFGGGGGTFGGGSTPFGSGGDGGTSAFGSASAPATSAFGSASAPAPAFGGGGAFRGGGTSAPAPSIFGGGSPRDQKAKKKQLNATASSFAPAAATPNPFAPAAPAPARGQSAAAAPNPFAPARGRTTERGKGRKFAIPTPDEGSRGRGGRGRGRASASPDDGGGRGRGRGRGKGSAGKGSAGGRVYCVKVQPIDASVDDATLKRAFEGTGARGLQSVRALGAYGYGNYAMRRDADAACQALTGQDLGAGAVYCSVKEKAAPKASEAPAPASSAADKVWTRTEAPAPAADKVWTRAPAPSPTGGKSREAVVAALAAWVARRLPDRTSVDDLDAFYADHPDLGRKPRGVAWLTPDLLEAQNLQKNGSFLEPLAASQPRLDTEAAARFVKGVIGGQTRRDDTARGACSLRITRGCPQDAVGLKSVCESFGAVASAAVDDSIGIVVFKDADGAKLCQEQLSGIDAFMAGPVVCSVGAASVKKKKAPPKTPARPPAAAPQDDLAARNAERFAAPPRRASKSPPPAPAPATRGGDLVGTCLQFCPAAEIEERVGFKELDAFEKPVGWEGMSSEELVQAARRTAVKKYKRSAAGSFEAKPEIIRPVQVLLQAFEHLRDTVIEWATGALEDTMARYLFLWDRFRAIRKDFILQNYTTGGRVGVEAIRVFEGVARYLVGIEKELGAHPEWREGIAHGKQNAESLSETLTALVAFYGAARSEVNASELLENEAEFTQYWLVYFLDQEQGAEAAHFLTRLALERPGLHATDEIQRAARIRQARLGTNWARFFSIVRAAPYLVRCLIVAQYADEMRADALRVLSRATQKHEAYDAADLARDLGLGVAACRSLVVAWGGAVDSIGNVLFQRPAAFDAESFDAGAFVEVAVEPLFGEENSVAGAVRGDPAALARAQAAARERRRVAEERAAAERARREAALRTQRQEADRRQKAEVAQDAQRREREAAEARTRAEVEKQARATAEAETAARAEAARVEAERLETEQKAAAEKEAKRQAWLAKEAQKLEDERQRRAAAEVERQRRREREQLEEARRQEALRLEELEEERRDGVRCERAARHEARALFLRFKRRCAARKAARARDKVFAAGVYLKRWRRAAAARRGARKRYFRALGSLDGAPAEAPAAPVAAPSVLSFASLAKAARAAPSLLVEQIVRLRRPPLDVRGAFPGREARVVLGVVGAPGDPLYEATLACLERGLASQKRRRADTAPAVALRKDGVGCCALLVACSLQHGRAAAVAASAAAADAGAVPVCVLHDGAVPEPLVDALSAAAARAAACGGARDPRLGETLRECLGFLGEASKPPPPPLLLRAAAPVRVPDAAQTKRARRALALAKYANTPPPAAKRARVQAALGEAQAASARLDDMLRAALAPAPPAYLPLSQLSPPSQKKGYYQKRIAASTGWQAAPEHDHYAALNADDSDSGYELRDGTHVDRHL